MRPERGVAGSSPRLADQYLWSAEDEMASEVEVGEFLYSLVRLLKPEFVVETGCRGLNAARRIVAAIEENGWGAYRGCDPWLPANSFIGKGNFDLWKCRSDSADMKWSIGACDLLFSDSDPKVRPEEVSWLKPGAIAVIHDTYVYPELGEFVKHQGGILFDTPRGLGIIRK